MSGGGLQPHARKVGTTRHTSPVLTAMTRGKTLRGSNPSPSHHAALKKLQSAAARPARPKPRPSRPSR